MCVYLYIYKIVYNGMCVWGVVRDKVAFAWHWVFLLNLNNQKEYWFLSSLILPMKSTGPKGKIDSSALILLGINP